MPQDAISALIWSVTRKNKREVLRHGAKLVIDSLADRLAAGEQMTVADVLKLSTMHIDGAGETHKPSGFLGLLRTLPPYRAEVVARHALARARRQVGVRKAWADEQKRTRMLNALLNVDHSKPETRKRLSEAQRRNWADPETRKHTIEGLRHAAQQRPYETTPETSKRLTEALHRRWQDPERRKRLSEAMRAAWADPEKRARFTEAIRRAWKTPEVKNRHSEGLRRAWARPEGRKQQSERMKRQWSKLAQAKRILAEQTESVAHQKARTNVGGRPRKDTIRVRARELKAGGKSWSQIQRILNAETGEIKTANAYRNLAKDYR